MANINEEGRNGNLDSYVAPIILSVLTGFLVWQIALMVYKINPNDGARLKGNPVVYLWDRTPPTDPPIKPNKGK